MLPKVRRAVWRRREDQDAYHDAIECAVREDLTSPAEEFLSALAGGNWTADPRDNPPADPEQIHDYAKLLARIEFLGINGSPQYGDAVGYLHSGIWELRYSARRLTYWDTPGDGTWTEHAEHDDYRTCDRPDDQYWRYPDMDEILRLGVAWPKLGQAAPQDAIAEAVRIREEDCAHDEP